MPNLVEFLSAMFLTGVGLALPVCIVVSIVRAIRTIGQHHDEPTRRTALLALRFQQLSAMLRVLSGRQRAGDLLTSYEFFTPEGGRTAI
jgi:hypothetical protein